MKSNLLKTALLASAFFGALGTASAEIVHANIPFEFSANGKIMPAGGYLVQSLPGSSSVLVFVNDATGAKAIAFARTISDASGKHEGTFFIKTAYKTYELGMAPTPLKGALLTLMPGK
jgi:hypothetical protein